MTSINNGHILDYGRHSLGLKQLKILKKLADDSFEQSLPDEFFEEHPIPEVKGWVPVLPTAIAVKLKHVEAHVDEWQGRNPVPSQHASLFWLMDIPIGGRLQLHVGLDACTMQRGDYVLFLDNIMHSVCASNVWRGIAIQMRPEESS